MKYLIIGDLHGSWINYYLLKFAKTNPFGWSSRRIGDLWCGFEKDLRSPWKYLRDTEHTHNPIDDAKGNAEALMKMLIHNKVIKLKKGDEITFKSDTNEFLTTTIFNPCVSDECEICVYKDENKSSFEFIELKNIINVKI